MEGEYNFGRCGVNCEMCATGNGTIGRLAQELKQLTAGFFKDFPEGHGGFDGTEFQKGLDHFSEGYGCPGCTNLKDEPWCDVLKCEKIAEKESCLLCEELPECPRTEYQRGRYPYVQEIQRRVKEVGFEAHLKEDREKAEKGVLLHDIREY